MTLFAVVNCGPGDARLPHPAYADLVRASSEEEALDTTEIIIGDHDEVVVFPVEQALRFRRTKSRSDFVRMSG